MKTLAALLVTITLPAQTISLSPNAWSVYKTGYNKPFHPTALPNGGWEFTYPIGSSPPQYCCLDTYLGYVNTTYHYPQGWHKGTPLTGTLYMTAQTVTTGNPEYYYLSNPDNICTFPAHARPYIDTGGQGEFDRWFAAYNMTPDLAFDLNLGFASLVVPIDPHNWISVYGKAGDVDATTLAGFNHAWGNIKFIGFVQGGGCFAGHGINVAYGTGTSRFQLLGYAIQ